MFPPTSVSIPTDKLLTNRPSAKAIKVNKMEYPSFSSPPKCGLHIL